MLDYLQQGKACSLCWSCRRNWPTDQLSQSHTAWFDRPCWSICWTVSHLIYMEWGWFWWAGPKWGRGASYLCGGPSVGTWGSEVPSQSGNTKANSQHEKGPSHKAYVCWTYRLNHLSYHWLWDPQLELVIHQLVQLEEWLIHQFHTNQNVALDGRDVYVCMMYWINCSEKGYMFLCCWYARSLKCPLNNYSLHTENQTICHRALHIAMTMANSGFVERGGCTTLGP